MHAELNIIIAVEILQAREKDCLWKDIPKKIKLLIDDFRLSSIINFIPPSKMLDGAIGHYQCYSIRNNEKVEVYDNQSQKVLPAESKVIPHVIFYCKI